MMKAGLSLAIAVSLGLISLADGFAVPGASLGIRTSTVVKLAREGGRALPVGRSMLPREALRYLSVEVGGFGLALQ